MKGGVRRLSEVVWEGDKVVWKDGVVGEVGKDGEG